MEPWQQVGTATMHLDLLTYSSWTPALLDHSQQSAGAQAPPITELLAPVVGRQLSIAGKVPLCSYRWLMILWIVTFIYSISSTSMRETHCMTVVIEKSFSLIFKMWFMSAVIIMW